MPLRPALAAFHPRGPEPRATRGVSCPHCGHGFSVSMRAMSVRCPACTRPLAFEDLTVRDRVEGDVSTMGHVALAAPSEMIGRLVCGQFTSGGRFDGRAVVYGPITLGDHSVTRGELTGKSLRIDPGASFRGRARIGPTPNVSPDARTLASHPLRTINRRITSTRAPAFAPLT